jgi:hypothetical protein
MGAPSRATLMALRLATPRGVARLITKCTPCGDRVCCLCDLPPSKSDGVILGQLEYPYMCDVDNVYAPYGGPTRVCGHVRYDAAAIMLKDVSCVC